MKITKSRLAELVREVVQEEKAEYEKFFRAMLKKYGVKSPAELSDEEKKKFFNQVDSEYKAKNEELKGNQHKLDVDGDGEIEASDLAALRAGNKIKKNESVNEASKPSIKMVDKFQPIEGIQIMGAKTLDGKTHFGGMVQRGKLARIIPFVSNQSKSAVQKRALQIYDELGKEESVNESSSCSCGCGTCSTSVNEEFKSKDSTFEKVYSIFDKKDYFNAKGLAKVQIGNFERALQKKDKGAEQILNNFKGDMNKAKEYIIQVISDRKKAQAFEDYKALKGAVDSIQKGKPEQGAVGYVKRIIHNNNQKYSMALYSALRNQKFTKWKDVHADVDSLIGESAVFEGRAFVAAAKKAKEEGKTEFEFNGKTYPVTLKD